MPLHRAGAADWMVSPLGDDLPGFWAPPRNTWSAYVRGLAGEVRELQAGLGAGQAPPRASDEPITATSWRAADGAAHGETGARTLATDEEREANMPALDARRGVSSPVLDEKPQARHDVSAPALSVESQPTASAAPVAELRYKVQFTADQAYVELLEEACNLLQHELPARDLAAVQRRALELLVQKLRQRKYAANERSCQKAPVPANDTPPPQRKSTATRSAAPKSATRARDGAPRSAADARRSTPQSSNQSRYIPAEVRRNVWQRDEARCAYVDARGQRAASSPDWSSIISIRMDVEGHPRSTTWRCAAAPTIPWRRSRTSVATSSARNEHAGHV